MRRSILLLTLTFGILFTAALGQQTPKHPGVVLLEQARFKDAVRSLSIATKTAEFKADAGVWNALGLAYRETGDEKKAIKAFEKSVALAPDVSSYHANLAYAYSQNRKMEKAMDSADKAVKLDPNNAHAYHVRAVLHFYRWQLDLAEKDADAFVRLDGANSQAYLLKSELIIARLQGAGQDVYSEKQLSIFTEAQKVLQAGAANSKSHPKYNDLVRELTNVTLFREHFERVATRRFQPQSVPEPPVPDPSVTPVKFLHRPKAMYTDEARSRGVQGAVRVALLLGAGGTVDGVLFISRLGSGLDQQVLKAIRQIKFEPKEKDGVPVPSVVRLEYTFSIY